ncbi:site-2 protease family protein [Nocardia stercoris]|uniref:Zinc metalloprotease n=1 Tax=Nocardia stercoris TaxID=2483361 RepID=A0A3M2L1D2_9NOCA|nr:site-2 protease family protein [Nocardia stercoris]RMI31457.1 CBS domain-containing protein [Nocardia stercoris]
MLRGTIPLGRIAGIRVGLNWSVLVTLALFTVVLAADLDGHGSRIAVWTAAATAAVLLLGALATHELAHSIVASRNGVRVDRIILWLLGGMSELTDEPPDARTELKVALAGPLTSLGIAVLAFLAAAAAQSAAPGSVVVAALLWLSVMNAALAVFNLLPGAPLDGGRVLHAALWWRNGDRLRSATTAARAGRALGVGLILLGIAEMVTTRQLGGLWLGLLGWFLQTSADGELAIAGMRHRLGDTRIRDVMSTPVSVVPARWTVTDLLNSTVAHSRHRVFPVVDDAGRPVDVVAWADLARVTPARRSDTTLDAVGRALPAGAVVTEDTLLADAAARVVLRPKLDAIVAVDAAGRVTGIVTATDLATACDRSALGLPGGTATAPGPARRSEDRPTATGPLVGRSR